MKKLFNSKFLFILASSLVVLIGLIIGAFYLFDNEDDSFVKSGYVLNPLSSISEKYFFDENVGYRENLSSMIEFVDVDEKKVSILKDSFIHYMDESVSFLKKGAILDMDTLSGNKLVSFYNITKESMIEKRETGYVIETANGDLKLNNFVGRISDNKYIVVGNLSLKMAGNATSVKGDYFEVVYVEEGIVNIENKDVKYQVAAEGTLIYVGNNKAIDLGDKKITLDGADVMSITAITIDGDENIEIIPKAEDEEDDGKDDEGDDERPTNPGNDGNMPGGNEEGGTGNQGVVGEITKEVVVSLKDAKIGSTNIDVIFDVLNAREDDSFKLQVVNLDSGRTVDLVAEVLPDVQIRVNLLTPNTKYLFMVINERDNGKYYQKVFETAGFGIRVEKVYSTDNSLSYEIIVDEGTDITNARFALYKFNEETMENEIVTTSYYDEYNGVEVIEEKVTYLKPEDSAKNIEGVHKITYDGLDSDTIYTAVLDEFSVTSVNFKDVYNVTLTSMTLKKTPNFDEMEETITKDVGVGSFDLSLGKVIDEDNAIISYTYQIYNKNTNEKAIKDIVHNNASPITILIGDDKDHQLEPDTNYYYRVIIEYFDNEKYLDYIVSDNIIFDMGSEPYITVMKNNDKIDFDKIGGTIYLTDNSCKIPVAGRLKCGDLDPANTYLKISKPDGDGGKVGFRNIPFKFELDEERNLKPYEFEVTGLEAGTKYYIDVITYDENLEEQEILHIETDDKYISTKSFTTFDTDWTRMNGSKEVPLMASLKLKGVAGTGSLTPEESAETLETIILRLYDGKDIKNIETAPTIGYVSFSNDSLNIKENFVDTDFRFTNETFGLNAEQLAQKSKGGELNRHYTLVVEVYAQGGNKIQIEGEGPQFVYNVAPAIFNNAKTTLEMSLIKFDKNKEEHKKFFPNLTTPGIDIGYNVEAYYDRQTMIDGDMNPEYIDFYVYNKKKEKISFLVKDEEGNLVLANEETRHRIDIRNDDSPTQSLEIYMDYGSDYYTIDELMRRGNEFYIGYEITARAGRESVLYPLANDGVSPTGYGMYEQRRPSEKEPPALKMYIASSTENSITYRYELSDPDYSLYKEQDTEDYGFYYIIGNGIETKVSMTKVEEFTDYNKFAGEITLNGLSDGMNYSLYFKRNMKKTDSLATDVDSLYSSVKKFDGYYDLGEEKEQYSFKYQIINDPYNDNKVIIKILANDDVLNRILSYNVVFSVNGGENTLERKMWNLAKCDNDPANAKPRCLSIDYIDLYEAGMKSELNNVRPISVSITAVYDNGLQGFDLLKDQNNKYSIMQGSGSESGFGAYLTYATKPRDSIPTFFAWNDDVGTSKGYYTTKFNFNTNQLTYTNLIEGKEGKQRLSLDGNGYYYNSAALYVTPKMVSMDEMGCFTHDSSTQCNQFWFYTVTPTVKVTHDTSILNGAIMNLDLFSLNIEDIKPEDGKHYLYIETWDNEYDAVNGRLDKVARPTVKAEIKKNETMRVLIDKLKELKDSDLEVTGKYWFNVYAYMNDGSNTYRQLYDEDSVGYQVVSYPFSTLMASDMFNKEYVANGGYGINYITSNDVYGDRALRTKFKLNTYRNSTAYNFDIVYTLCEESKLSVCDPNVASSYIFKDSISVNELAVENSRDVDISKYNLEYGKEYILSIYAVVDFYDANLKKEVKRNVLINPYNRYVNLSSLVKPSFVVTRKAFLENGENGIEFTVNINDPSKALINGNYYVRLFEAEDKEEKIVGSMKLLDKDKNYYDVANYHEYAFDAFETKKTIRIVGLDSNTLYSFEVYGDAYLNNYNSTHKCNNSLVLDENGECVLPNDDNKYNPEKVEKVSKTYTAYSANDYGIAFGNPTFALAKKSALVKFSYGSNFENVTKVNYTIGNWNGVTMSNTKSGEYIINVNKKFDYDSETDQYTLRIDDYIGDDGFVEFEDYKIIVRFTLKDSVTGEEVVGIYPEFSDELTYYNEDKKQE